jgi:hypothetical protein
VITDLRAASAAVEIVSLNETYRHEVPSGVPTSWNRYTSTLMRRRREAYTARVGSGSPFLRLPADPIHLANFLAEAPQGRARMAKHIMIVTEHAAERRVPSRPSVNWPASLPPWGARWLGTSGSSPDSAAPFGASGDGRGRASATAASEFPPSPGQRPSPAGPRRGRGPLSVRKRAR